MPGDQSLLPYTMFEEKQGTRDLLSAALSWRRHRHPTGEAFRVSQLVETVCPGAGPRFFFSSPLSSLSLLILPTPSLSPRLFLAPGAAATPESQCSLESTPLPARGDGGIWQAGRGRGQ